MKEMAKYMLLIITGFIAVFHVEVSAVYVVCIRKVINDFMYIH